MKKMEVLWWRSTSKCSSDLDDCSLNVSYDAAEDNEISFKEGERISEISKVDPDWWEGKAADGKVGLFPGEIIFDFEQEHAEHDSRIRGSARRLPALVAISYNRKRCISRGSMPGMQDMTPFSDVHLSA